MGCLDDKSTIICDSFNLSWSLYLTLQWGLMTPLPRENNYFGVLWIEVEEASRKGLPKVAQFLFWSWVGSKAPLC